MTKEYLLEDFIKELNFEDIKKNHVGDDFRIDFNYDDSIICWFDPTGDHKSFDCIEITEDMDKFDFEWEVKKIQDVIKELEDIQKNLTVTAEDYRQRHLDWVNDELEYNDLKPIEIKKYKDENAVFEEIKKNNAENPDIDDFLEENALIPDEIPISLVKEKDGTYSTWDYYTDNGEVIEVIYAPMKQVLSTDNIIYKPRLSDCKKIDDKFSYKTHGYSGWER